MWLATASETLDWNTVVVAFGAAMLPSSMILFVLKRLTQIENKLKEIDVLNEKSDRTEEDIRTLRDRTHEQNNTAHQLELRITKLEMRP